ncbi:unnamed protein product, partial [Ectocarpus sp. 6 AP-2014]
FLSGRDEAQGPQYEKKICGGGSERKGSRTTVQEHTAKVRYAVAPTSRWMVERQRYMHHGALKLAPVGYRVYSGERLALFIRRLGKG